MASATVSWIGAGCCGDDKTMGIWICGVYLSTSFFLPPLPLYMGIHVIKRIGCEKHVPPEVWVEEYPVDHGKARSINSPSWGDAG